MPHPVRVKQLIGILDSGERGIFFLGYPFVIGMGLLAAVSFQDLSGVELLGIFFP